MKKARSFTFVHVTIEMQELRGKFKIQAFFSDFLSKLFAILFELQELCSCKFLILSEAMFP